jgi:hypothetical protein
VYTGRSPAKAGRLHSAIAKGHTVGIADLCGDLVDALAAGSQQMHRTLDAQILEVREGCLAQYALHAPRQGAFTGARCDGRIGEREPVRELLPGPALKALDHRVGMGQVIGDHELSLRAAGLYQQVSRRQSRQRWATAAHDAQCQVEMSQGGAGRGEAGRIHKHAGLVEHHVRIALPKHWRQPPRSCGALAI